MDKKLSTRHISNMVIVARTIALISIVSAHIGFTQVAPSWLLEFYRMFGTIGVVTFFVISGYYYHVDKYGSFFHVVKKKLKTIGVPWLVLGTVGYLCHVILSKSISVIEYFNFIFGNGSYLYFMTILFLCFIIFYFCKSKIFCIAAILLNVLTLELTAAGVLEPVIKALHITNHLNIFNWIGFFAFGFLCQNIDTDKLYNVVIKFRLPSLIIFCLFFVMLFITKFNIGYFSYIGWIFEIVGTIAIFSISTFSFLNVKLIRKISNESFTIYLIQFMVIGLINDLYNVILPLQIFANVIVVLVSFLAVELCMFIAKKIKIDKLASTVLGVRNI